MPLEFAISDVSLGRRASGVGRRASGVGRRASGVERRAVGVRRLAVEAGVGASVAGRWGERLVGAGLVERVVDPCGGALLAVRLSDAGAEAMEDYFALLIAGWARR